MYLPESSAKAENRRMRRNRTLYIESGQRTIPCPELVISTGTNEVSISLLAHVREPDRNIFNPTKKDHPYGRSFSFGYFIVLSAAQTAVSNLRG